MSNRPIIKIVTSTTDRFIEYISWGILVGIWIYAFVGYSSLPDVIPIHFNLKGEVDGHSNKAVIFLLALIPSIVAIGLSALNRFPHLFNYPITITENNARYYYTNATRLIRYLKLIISVVFIAIIIEVNTIALYGASGLGPWSVPIIIVLVILPIIYYLRKTYKTKIN